MMTLAGKILLTGSGFLARGILRRAKAENWPNEIVVYSRSPASQAICRNKYRDPHYVTGDIRDIERLKLAMLGAETVVHTAAFKYVPEAEVNVGECVSVNIDGTQSVLLCARENYVSNVVIISTDKAVHPVNVYGMTKAIGERLMTEMSAADTGGTQYRGVRYGNVIGSTGSVVPVLREQALRDGFVSVTNPAMTRFWITVEDAIDLIIRSMDADICQGSIIVPFPKSMRLDALINAILPDVSTRLIGDRPGEKLHEDLITANESLWTRDHDDVYELLALKIRQMVAPGKESFMVNSKDAARFTASDFLDAVEDATHV